MPPPPKQGMKILKTMANRLIPAGSTPSDFVIIYGDDMPHPPKQGMKILKTVAARGLVNGRDPHRRCGRDLVFSISIPVNHAIPVSTDPDKPKISWTWTQTRHKSCTDRPPEDSTPQSARTSSSHYPSSHLYKHKQEPTS